MKPPVVGKRYRVRGWRKGEFVGACVEVGWRYWKFKLESPVGGLYSGWVVGEVVSVSTTSVGELKEMPLDVARVGA